MPNPRPHGLLRRHAGRLSHELNELVERMEQSTAEAVARIVAALVNEAVRSILRGKDAAQEDSPPILPRRYTPTWRDPDNDRDWTNDPFGVVRDPTNLFVDEGRSREDAYDDEPILSEEIEPDATPTRTRWFTAILAALQAAGCYLRARPGRMTLTSLGVGLAVGVATLVVGGICNVAALLGLCELLVASAALLQSA